MSIVPDSLPAEIDRSLEARDREFLAAYHEIGINYEHVLEHIDFNQPFVKENNFQYKATVSLRFRVCDAVHVMLDEKDLPNPQILALENPAIISRAYFEARRSEKQAMKLMNKQYHSKLQAAEKILRSFPIVVKGLKENGKQIIRLLPPTPPASNQPPENPRV